MTKETGTLAELNVKPGDVVAWHKAANGWGWQDAKFKGTTWSVRSDNTIFCEDLDDRFDVDCSHVFRLVSRAAATPKTWGEMTDEERRDISFSAMSGQVIDINAYGGWVEWDGKTPLCETHQAIRVRPPEPKRKTVTLYGGVSGRQAMIWMTGRRGDPHDTHSLTLPLLDGNIPAGTYTSEAGETIIVEEL